jgi:hypothetical protein
MSAAEWRAIAHPVIADMLAYLEEFLEEPRPQHFAPALVRRYRAAGRCRDPQALRRLCVEIRREAHRRMLAGEGQDKERAA